MLSLRFSTDDYAFVYTEGRPIGAILVGKTKGRSQFSLLFSGREMDFEILRPQAVERRFGRQELERLRSRFFVSARSSPLDAVKGLWEECRDNASMPPDCVQAHFSALRKLDDDGRFLRLAPTPY